MSYIWSIFTKNRFFFDNTYSVLNPNIPQVLLFIVKVTQGLICWNSTSYRLKVWQKFKFNLAESLFRLVVPGILAASAGKLIPHMQDLASTSCLERNLALHCIQDNMKQNQT